MSFPAPRYGISVSLILLFHDPKGRFRGVTRNISESGMLVVSTAMRRRGSPVQFESSIFSGGAEVIWTREDHEGEMLLGLKFIELSNRDRNALHKLLEPPQRPG